MKGFLTLVLALALCLGLCAPAMAAEFTDVPAGHPFYDAVSYCVEKGVASGYGDGSFKPANTVSRSNFCVMLSRAFFPGDIIKYSTEFVMSFGQFFPNYLALVNNGVWKNVSFYNIDSNFYSDEFAASMNNGISRYDMAQLMTNIMSKNGFSASEADKSAAAGQISDYSGIPSQYKDAVANVYALGVIGGYADGTFGGNGTMNRGQAAAVIYRMVQKMYPGGELPVPVEPEVPEAPGPVELETPETPETPAVPETPEAPASGTLTNGKPITVDNVSELLEELRVQWPMKTDLGPYTAGSLSPVNAVANYYVFGFSTATKCGGGAARIADALFGTNVTFRRVTGGYDAARPGDILIDIDANGKMTHMAVVYQRTTVNGWTNCILSVDTNAGGGANVITWGGACPDPVKFNITSHSYEFWTAYPD